MNLTKEQVTAGVEAGLALTDPSSDLLHVFRRHAGGIMVLQTLLTALAKGEIVFSQAEPKPVLPTAEGNDKDEPV